MADLPTDWTSLAALALLLGLKHGFDADHLATIDALTRLQRSHRAARWCGALFSLGHGAVVTAVGTGLALVQQRAALPHWLHTSGAAISIVVLLALGIANLRALLAGGPGDPAPAGWLARQVAAHLQGRSLWTSAAVGALFALSFDTLSQAALFALAAPGSASLPAALVLGGLFTIGMLATDAANGWCISRLLARADALARRTSRLMGWAVAGASLGIAALGTARLAAPALDHWADARAGWLGAGVVALLAASFGLAWALAAADRRAAQGAPASDVTIAA